MKIKNKKAFTIVELLTVISVITIIIGLLVPGLNKVRKIAKDTKQKAQFHAIEVALEMFKTEQENYPSSLRSQASGEWVTGTHKLSEALLGRDLQGYDPVSNMDDPSYTINNDPDTDPYGVSASDNDEAEKSLDRRQGPYLDVDRVEAFDAAQIYGSTRVNAATDKLYAGAFDENGDTLSGNSAPLIADVYKTTKLTLATGKTVNVGTPILYYKANTANKFNDNSLTTSAAMVQNNVYNLWDNQQIVELKSIKEKSDHKINADDTDGRKDFYEMIANNAASANLSDTDKFSRPYRAESYIIISAGYDGIFGNSDDIVNFGE